MAAFATAQASQAFFPYVLYLNTTDGQTVEFKLATEPVATFEEGSIVLTVASGDAVAFELDKVTNLTFAADPDGVKSIAADKKKLSVTITDEQILIDGLDAVAPVAVYDTNGRKIVADKADSAGHAQMAIGNLNKGVYVVSTPSQSFKFIK